MISFQTRFRETTSVTRIQNLPGVYGRNVSNPLPGNHLCDVMKCYSNLMAIVFQTRFRETTSVTATPGTSVRINTVSNPLPGNHLCDIVKTVSFLFQFLFQTRFRETTSVTKTRFLLRKYGT